MKNKQLRELAVCGFEAVRALAEQHPEKIQRLFFTHDRSKYFGPVCRTLASERKVYRTVETEKELEKLCGSVHHQGVVAMIPEPEIPSLTGQALQELGTKKMVLLLDRVGNANNLGAIIRSAAFFGADTIILSEEDDQAQVSTSMYRVAQGGMEFVSLWRVPSSCWILDKLPPNVKSVGADHRSSNEVHELDRLIPNGATPLIVLGNEETGLSPETKKACNCLVKISGTGAIESLNVAQAAGILIYTATKIVETKTR